MGGFYGLLQKEVLRFWRVVYQTIGAPVLATLLWMLVFSHVLGERVQVWGGLSYTEFLIPGLVMMAVLQNAFSNSSSSLIQSKIAGNIILMILPPITPLAFFAAYTSACVLRGLLVGAGVMAAGIWFEPSALPQSPHIVILFALLGGTMAGALGLVVGLWAEKFDQIGLFTNFIIMPLTFLSGVFYSISTLPPFWRTISQFNPFLYMIDGFRWGFYNQGDIPLLYSIIATTVMTAAVSWLAWYLVKIGYKMKT
ncbi:MAG: ABC transporter permease [Gammaproteobacteria bacterium WSBS_2016_MAG_OTU1]